MSAIQELFSHSDAIPSIPKVVHEILATMNQEDVSPRDILAPLQRDPSLSAKVLRMANSAHYGLQRGISSIEEAVLMVGIDAVRNLVITSGLVGSFKPLPQFDMRLFWRISLLSAVLSRDFSHRLGGTADTCYVAALMHGLGLLTMQAVYGNTHSRFTVPNQWISPAEQQQHEQERFGLSHNEVAAEIAQRWQLPAGICETILQYPQPALSETASVEAYIVNASIVWAHELEMHVRPEFWGKHIAQEVSERLEPAWSQLKLQTAQVLRHQETAELIVG